MEQNERIATLETQLDGLSKGLDRIESKLDAYSSNFLTRNEADIRFQNVDKELEEVKTNKRANNALVVSVFAVLVTIVFGVINLMGGGQ